MISIGFSRPKSPFALVSKLICYIEKTDYSHVYMQIGQVIVHANHVGVSVIYAPDFFAKHESIIYEPLEVNKDQFEKILGIIIPYFGKKYGFLQIFGILISMILKLPKNPINKGFVCSEFIALILQKVYNIKIDKDINLVTPKDVYDILRMKPWLQ